MAWYGSVVCDLFSHHVPWYFLIPDSHHSKNVSFDSEGRVVYRIRNQRSRCAILAGSLVFLKTESEESLGANYLRTLFVTQKYFLR